MALEAEPTGVGSMRQASSDLECGVIAGRRQLKAVEKLTLRMHALSQESRICLSAFSCAVAKCEEDAIMSSDWIKQILDAISASIQSVSRDQPEE